MKEAINMTIDDELKAAFQEWIDGMEDGDKSKLASQKILNIINKGSYTNNEIIKEILDKKIFL